MRLFGETKIPFLSYRWRALSVSAVAIIFGVAYIGFGPGLNLGIDFDGGTQVTIKLREAPDLKRLREVLSQLEVGEPTIQTFDEVEKHEILIRVGNPESEGITEVAQGEEVAQAEEAATQGEETADTLADRTRPILELLRAEFNSDISGFDLNTHGAMELGELLMKADPEHIASHEEARTEHYRPMAEAVSEYRKVQGLFLDINELDQIAALSDEVRNYLKQNAEVGAFALLGAESVGPAVGKDLSRKASFAILFSLLGMLAYIWIRFQLPYGIGAVVALFHDVAITLTALAIFQREINLPTVAALLTLVGYSVNDTVVVFDRVRENLRKSRGMDLQKLMDLSINQCLSRTVITSGTTLAVVLSLYLFGGDVINTFALVLLVGVLVGTYSSMFVASPVALSITWAVNKRRRNRRSRGRK